MFQKIVTSALIAGFGAGLLAAVLQLMFVQPVLLHAEAFEQGVLSHFDVISSAADAPTRAFEPLRDGMSIIFSAIIYCGYALILLAAMVFAEERGAEITARTGIIWGVAGFVAVQLAPAFSLPPELPGMAAGDLQARQIWWFATVAVTALALWFLAFGKGWMLWGPAIVLLAAPHLIGAPQPDVLTGPAPPELGAMFAARAIGVGLAAWVALGALTATLWRTAPEERLA